MKKLKSMVIAMLILLSPTLLTGCSGKEEIQISTYSDIYIPDDKFVCSDEPTKPVIVYETNTNRKTYLSSDVSKYLVDLQKAGGDCRTRLETVREIYKRQKLANEKITGLDKGKVD